MEKDSLIELISFQKGVIDNIINQIIKKDRNASISSNRSIKDIIAHISWYESRIIEAIKEGPSFRDNRDNLSLDEINNEIYEENKDIDIDSVLQNSKLTFEKLINAIKNINDSVLNNAHLIPGMPSNWLPWKGIYANSIDHYYAHKNSLEKWLAENDKVI